jgi:hypothetical protein
MKEKLLRGENEFKYQQSLENTFVPLKTNISKLLTKVLLRANLLIVPTQKIGD